MSYGDPANPGSPASGGAQLVNYPLTHSTFDYLRRLMSLGVMEGPLGKMAVAEALRPVFDAMHVVLAGGEVKIDVVRRGHPDTMRELQARYEQAAADANAINAKSGWYVTIT
ncbi:hypothetical protein [Sandaracinus amylolyticus]|uniref:hypothetical protein n=1 Tax=Sandaracinus amylolyticus TaxID=927083 RepID=UPI001F2E09E0|nr:hypothetical protein [Sandaracinus amylolyticus]UJR79212.1 Hypothetical protein I5071_12450 [Sandaracinus amylolyticus]